MLNEAGGGHVKHGFLLSLVLLLAMPPVISTAQQQDQAGSRPESDATPKQQNPPVNKPVQPANSFTPSEKIRADDAVSFPVDI